MMHRVVIIVLALLTMFLSLAQASLISRVQTTENAAGLKCAQIPEIVAQKLGVTVLSSKWWENKVGKTVSLNLLAQKDVMVDTVYMSYQWTPEWTWKVANGSGVVPVNTMAEEWMKGNL